LALRRVPKREFTYASEQELELTSLQSQLADALAKLRKIKAGILALDDVADSERQDKLQRKLKEHLNAQQSIVLTITARIELLRELPPPQLNLHAIITKKLYQGAIFRFEDDFLRVRERRGGTLIQLNDNQLIMDVLR